MKYPELISSIFHRKHPDLLTMDKTKAKELEAACQHSNDKLQVLRDINLLLVGCKGNGKSHTGNTILGQEVFTVSRKGGTEKSSLGSSSHEVDGVSMKVTVVDTPGVTQKTAIEDEPGVSKGEKLGMTESEFEELVRAVKMVPEGFDAICLVWDYNNSERNDDKEVQVFQSLHRLFGDRFYEHLVIVVTHAQEEDIPEFLTTLPDSMKSIANNCPYRVTVTGTMIDVISKQSSTLGASRFTLADLSSVCKMPQLGEKEKDEIHLLLVGKTGVGKSKTGNSITGTDIFTVSDTTVSKTDTCEHFRGKVGNLTIDIVDTPGIDLSCEESETTVKKWFQERSADFDAILLISERGKYGVDDEKMASITKRILGDKFSDHVIMVITGKDQLTESEEDYITDAPVEFRETLQKCNDRYVFFDNVTKDETLRREQLVNLIRLILKMTNRDTRPTSEVLNTEQIKYDDGPVILESDEKIEGQTNSTCLCWWPISSCKERSSHEKIV